VRQSSLRKIEKIVERGYYESAGVLAQGANLEWAVSDERDRA
jgi:hypothetical protein